MTKNVGTKIAYIYASDAAAEGFVNEFIKWMKANHNVEPVLKAKVQAKEIDFRTPLLKAKALKPDAFVIAGQVICMVTFSSSDKVSGVPPQISHRIRPAASQSLMKWTIFHQDSVFTETSSEKPRFLL